MLNKVLSAFRELKVCLFDGQKPVLDSKPLPQVTLIKPNKNAPTLEENIEEPAAIRKRAFRFFQEQYRELNEIENQRNETDSLIKKRIAIDNNAPKS
jgi:hypothetical protein